MSYGEVACPDIDTPVCLRCPFIQVEGTKLTKSCDKVRYSQYSPPPKECQKTREQLIELCKTNNYPNTEVIISMLLGTPIP